MLLATFFRDNSVHGPAKGARVAIHASLNKIYE